MSADDRLRDTGPAPEAEAEPAPLCRLCGREVPPEYADLGLCEMCYWDDQTGGHDLD